MKYILVLLLFASNVQATLSKKEVVLNFPEEQESKELVVSPDCEITIDGKKAKLGDLKDGMDIEFVIKNGKVVKISATKK